MPDPPPPSRPTPGFVERRRAARDDPWRSAHHDAIFTFARACELHDGDTGSHIVRIRRIVEAVARAMGFDAADAEDLGYDAMLHDVGKLDVPAAILRKPDPLTDDERRTMEAHTIHGERLLADRESLRRAARIARHHHEAWDGSGYPDGLAGEAIPVEARITAAADVLDALLADRSYKQAWSHHEAVEAVCDLAGTRLDPEVVAALRRCDDDGTLAAVFETPDGSP